MRTVLSDIENAYCYILIVGIVILYFLDSGCVICETVGYTGADN